MATTTGFVGAYILFLFDKNYIMYNYWQKHTILQILYVKVMFLYCFKIFFFVEHT